MPRGFIITGTDTGLGKTVFAAMLTLGLNGTYFKPVQAGLEQADSETIRTLIGSPKDHILPELYRLNTPASPHLSAEIDRVEIDVEKINQAVARLPVSRAPYLIEAAGGLLVPLTRQQLYIDLFKAWNLPVILCARTSLGTINHTLMSVEALKTRDIPLHGIAFIGEEMADSEQTIIDFSGAKKLGRLPILNPLDKDQLAMAFESRFNRADFA